ncbi:hypothetical protein LshimejAT787_0204440 [Lyophyllum shimeji]|uniref:DUF6699 domain-containing protein n=1 Tax=Lyophyllum shimeji TaxID=47721 RepID=A0A9P3PG49_LYOSH|nr:hypothetical protein LshimejAT787_0204440 [Lyophyllum shimeji]
MACCSRPRTRSQRYRQISRPVHRRPDHLPAFSPAWQPLPAAPPRPAHIPSVPNHGSAWLWNPPIDYRRPQQNFFNCHFSTTPCHPWLCSPVPSLPIIPIQYHQDVSDTPNHRRNRIRRRPRPVRMPPPLSVFNPPTRTELPVFNFPQPLQHQWPQTPSDQRTPPRPQHLLSPSPFPPDPRNVHEVLLHPILGKQPNGTPHTRWILSQNPFTSSRWDDYSMPPVLHPGAFWYHQQATHPPCARIEITYTHRALGPLAQRQAHILVNPRPGRLEITVMDILQAIYDHFMTPLIQIEVDQTSQEERNTIAEGWGHRRAIHLGHADPWDHSRRVDALGTRTRFGGLRSVSSQNGTTVLQMDLLSSLTL